MLIDVLNLLTGNSLQGVSIQNALPVTMAPKSINQTLKTFTGVVTTSTSTTQVTTLYTVTVGKIFYLTDVCICNNTANPCQASINASSTAGTSPILIGHSLNTAPLEVTNIGTEPSVAGGSPLTVQMGATTAVTAITYFIAGYEQ